MDPTVETLMARVEELERRVDVLFKSTGAMDFEETARTAPEVPPEVQSLMAKGDIRKAAKVYMKETGADMAQTMAALGELEKQARGE